MTPPTISFIDNHTPPLKDGQYTLELTHQLTYKGEKGDVNQSFYKKHTFAVCGERFALLPKEIHKVFPPANTQGDYDSVLPHVVLTRRTLPWERTPDGSTTVGDGKVRSWLALMVFSQSEAPPPVTGMLAHLYPAATADGGGELDKAIGTYSYGSPPQPKNTFLQYRQKSTDACVYLDIPQNLFAAYAPSLADLQWNAHARCRTHKDDSTDDYAVVVATRLPPAGETVVVHLVSLEGLGDQLPQDDGTFKQPAPQWTAIRLVSLKSWSFRVGPLQESFADVLKGLNGGVQARDSQLRLPAGYQPAAAPNAAPAAPFYSGYTVLAGQDPAKAAWYRGPFAPSTVTPPATDNTRSSTLLPADHATDLSATVSATPATDQTYLAAWQLGRLIALADKNFALAQVTWKRDCRLKLNTASRQANLAAGGSRAGYAKSMRDIIKDKDKIQSHLGGTLTVDLKATDALYIPQPLVDWLGKLALLNGVPFHYLVPDAAMLPPESIRFFNVDQGWIACLLDSAWSLGREPKQIWAFDTAYQPWSDLLKGNLKPSFSNGLTCWLVSGVLLNSRLLPGYWPGIDFAPDDDDPGKHIHLLREDRLGPTTLLLLYDQTFKTLTVQEPPEGIHFGFDMDDLGNLSKKLRYVSENNAYYPSGSGKTPPPEGTPDEFVGSDVPGPDALTSIPQRTADVIQFDRLADQMKTALGVPTFTAAEFALQLVEGVPAVKFTLPS